MKHWFTLFLLCVLISLSSCDLINPEEPIPAYIRISSIDVNSDYSLEGSNSSKVTDAWIFIDDELLGAFELPCEIPAIYNGSHRISIGPGVMINGIANTRATYPFYSNWDIEATMVAGQTLTLSPSVTYIDSSHFAFIANFDDLSGNKLQAAPGSDTIAALTNIPSEIFEGNGSFKSTLHRDSGYVAFQMVDPVILPTDGHLVYLEMDYNINQQLIVGSYATFAGGTSANDLVTLNKTNGWNKIYINLTTLTSNSASAENFRLYFTAVKPAGSEPLKILIDNLKIIF